MEAEFKFKYTKDKDGIDCEIVSRNNDISVYFRTISNGVDYNLNLTEEEVNDFYNRLDIIRVLIEDIKKLSE